MSTRSSAPSSASATKHALLIVIDDRPQSFCMQRACSPSRAALLTVRYNLRYGFQSSVLKEINNYSLPLT